MPQFQIHYKSSKVYKYTTISFTNYAILFKVQKIITLQSTKVQITPMEIPNTMIYQVPSSV